MTGRESAETSGYFPSYSAFGVQRGHEDVLGEVVARVDDLDLDCAGGAGAFPDGLVLPGHELADVDRAHTTSTPHCSRIQRTAIDVSSPPE